MVLFGFFALVLVSVYWVNRAVALFDQLIADGQSAGVFLEFTALSLPNVIRLVLPIAAFIAAVYVTNRLTSESELVVVQSSGFSPFRLARPVAMFGLLVALLMAVLVHVLVPISRSQLADREGEIANDITARFLTEGQFLHPADGITFYIRDISAQGELLDVFLSDVRSTGQRTTYMAKRALLLRRDDGPKLIMFDGSAQTFTEATQRLFITRFSDFSYDIGDLITGNGRSRRDVREYGTPMLFNPTQAALDATRRDVSDFRYEGHLRMVQPLQALVTALIGFSALMLGQFSRFGVWRQIMLAVVLLIVVQVLETAAAGVARSDPAAWPLVYLPTALGGTVSMVMLWLAGRPALFRRRRRPAEPADTGGQPA
jgi:lipopolysaccharide export system permease protein